MTKVDEWLGEKFNQEILWDVDSLAFYRAEWKTQELSGGLQLRKSSIKLWETMQSISYVNYSPVMFTTNIGYTGSEATVGDIATACNKDAIFAVNAGTLKNGKPAEMFKFNEQYINDQVSLTAEALFGLTPTKISDDITLVSTTLTSNVDDHAQYNSAMVTGPVLVRGGKALKATDFPEDEYYTTRMARTFVGTAASGNTILCTIDGGVVGQAEGVTAAEAAFIAQHMGLKTAALLSCGDDATVWSSANGVENAPSAGSAQKVGSVIYISPGTVSVKGDGSQSNPYLIENYVHMMILRSLCPAVSETYFRLEADIDMSAIKLWTPLNFDGDFTRKIHFDGNGKTISNFAPEQFVADDQVTAATYASLFGVLYGSCKNLTIKDAKVLMPLTQGSATGILGGFVGTADKGADVQNVHVVNGEVSGGRDCGLFGGQSRDASLVGCTANGTITGGAADCGGFIGRAAGHISLDNCHSDVYLTLGQNPGSNFRYGGLIGFMATIGGTDTTRDDLTIKRCSSTGTFFNDSFSGQTVAGLVGYINSSAAISETFTTFSFVGAEKAEVADAGGPVGGNHAACGGIAGVVSSVGTVTVTNCWTGGDGVFTSGQKSGGLIGVLEKGVLTIENCYSNYDMLSYSGAGGVFGQTKAGTLTINKTFAWNPRVITYRAPDKYSSGAFAGCIAQACTITNCFRNPQMEFVDPYRSLKDHADIAGAVIPNDADENPNKPTANNNAYDASPSAEATLSAAAKKLGWDESVWDLSGDVPVLK